MRADASVGPSALPEPRSMLVTDYVRTHREFCGYCPVHGRVRLRTPSSQFCPICRPLRRPLLKG